MDIKGREEFAQMIEDIVEDKFNAKIQRVEELERRLEDPALHASRWEAMVDRGAQALISFQVGAQVITQSWTAHDIARIILTAALKAPA